MCTECKIVLVVITLQVERKKIKVLNLTPECMVTLVAYQLIRRWFTLLWKINCIKAPKGQLHSSSYNINTTLIEGVNINALEELSYMLLMQACDSLLRVVSVVWLEDELCGYQVNCVVTR